ncbi:response regulator [Hyphobacterium marinum]|uniref:histidine kinase n=1 Tax=Hyphobacterium marinum TaxID=3116574 RepID=A0ABU7LYA0_9PROT|nr:response regulator [Hyphobacterium sp. Y6023]MEE2566170.1 response regulator [Hyphobacterium sp. Y6023]
MPSAAPPGGDDPAEDRDAAIRAIRYEAYYRSSRGAVLFNIVAALLLAVALYGQIPLAALIAWTAAVTLVSAGRFASLTALLKLGGGRALDAACLTMTVLTGVLWGTIIFLIPAGQDTMANSAIILVIVGITAGGAISSAARPMASILYNFPPLAGLALYYAAQGGVTGYVMCALVMIFFAAAYRLSKTGETTLVKALENNQDLDAARKRVESQARALKELARRHETAARRAEDATQVKSSFLASISQEIRTPLNGMMSVAMSLEGEDGLSQRQRTKVRTLREAGDMLVRLVGDLMDFSKIESGRMALVPGPMTMGGIAHDVETMWAERATARSLNFTVSCTGSADTLLEGDAARLKQVLFNFISNAFRFTRTGSIAVKLSLAEEGGRGRLRAEVHDTGTGVPREAQGRLFQGFSQFEAGTGRPEGTGLGLMISRRLMEMMGGAIGHMPAEGGGSVFWFEAELPAAGQQAAPKDAAERPAEPAAAIRPSPPAARATEDAAPAEAVPRPLRILAAEDNAINRSVLEGFLMSQGWSVDFAENGQEAVEAAHARAYDVILMDMRMPVMDGLAATRAIRDLPTTASMTPIVALTANARPEDEAACLGAGMDGYVSKPIDARRLFGAISQAVNGGSEAAAPAAKRA